MNKKDESFRKNRVLFLWPPEKIFSGSLFRHYTSFGETIGYISSYDWINVTALDAGITKRSYKDYYKMFKNNDVLILCIENYTIESAVEISKFAKQVNSNLKIVAYGTACCYIPLYFIRMCQFDAVIPHGQVELAIMDFLLYINNKKSIENLTKIIIKSENNQGYEIVGEEKVLDPAFWAHPEITKLPIEDYFQITGKRQLEIIANKGCIYPCSFCMVKKVFGCKDMRRPTSNLIDFILKTNTLCESYFFHGTTFTYDREWVLNLCTELVNKNLKIKWEAVTRVDSLDDELIERMSGAGCYRLSLGIETFSKKIQNSIKKTIDEELIVNICNKLKSKNIIPKALLIIGLENQDYEDIRYTIDILKQLGMEYRFKEYAPYNDVLNDEYILSNPEIIKKFSRNSATNIIEGLSDSEYMNYLFA